MDPTGNGTSREAAAVNEHVDLDLEPFLPEAADRPLARALAGHLGAHCPSCTGRLVAAGFPAGEIGPCWHLGDVPRLFAEGSPDPLEWQLLLHVAGSCPGCRKGLAPLLELLASNTLPARPTPMGIEVALALSRQGADGLAEPFLAASFEGGTVLAETLPAFHRWGVAEQLCRHSHKLASQDPEQAFVLARLAELLARNASLPGEPPETAAVLRMLATAHRGNALRVLDELRGAKASFEEAERAWAEAGGGAEVFFRVYRTEFFYLRASLWIDSRRFDRAELDLGLCLDEARACTDLPRFFRAEILLKLGYLYLCMANGRRAWRASRDAALLLAEAEAPRLCWLARQNELTALVAMSQHHAAAALLPRVKTLVQVAPAPQDPLRVTWTEARLAGALGHFDQAEQLFTTVRQGFLALGAGLSAAIATIELAQVLFANGKAALVRPLAEEMLVVFKAQNLDREFNAALVQFQQAALTERLTAEFLAELVTYCRKAEYDPRLRFRVARG